MANLSDGDCRRRAVAMASQLPPNLHDATRVLGYLIDVARFTSGQFDQVPIGTTPVPVKLRGGTADAA